MRKSGERMSGKAERNSGKGERVSGGGERNSGKGERVSGGGERVSGNGERVSGGGERISGKVDRISGGGRQEPPGGVEKAQAEVDGVLNIMENNIKMILERDHKLDVLEQKSESLINGASEFEKKSRKIHKKYEWKNRKLSIIIAAISITIVLIIIIMLIVKLRD